MLPIFERKNLPRKALIFAVAAAGCVLAFARPASASVILDGTVDTVNNSHNGTTFTDVFTTSQIGYAFYRDGNGSCSYVKTTDGGATWGTAVTIDSQTDCLRVAVWYDRWTPGNTTGTMIHIATLDSGSDDMWYTRLDTSNDTKSTTLDISGTNQGGTFAAGGNLQTITEGTDGALYAGVEDAADSFVLRCTTNCTSSITQWTEVGTSATWILANDWLLLNPLPNGNILAVQWDNGANDVESKVWNNASSTWSTTWTIFDNNCSDNTTYDGHFGSTVNLISNEIYLAYACNVQTLSSGTGSIKTQTYSSSTWTRDANIESSSTLGLTGIKIGLDSNTGNVYAVYSGRTTANSANTANVYYRISTSTTMSSWGARQGPVNSTTTDIFGLRIEGQNSSILYATWVDGNASSLNGTTIATFTPTTFTQAAYRFFDNANSAQVGNPFGSTNTPSIIPMATLPFRLRMLVRVVGTGADVNALDLKLQYATSTGGGCDTAFSGETYVDVATSTGAIRYYDNAGVGDGAALTANVLDPIDGTNVIVNQTYDEVNPVVNGVAKIFGGQDGKWDFSLKNASGTQGSTYCFRLVRSSGSVLDGYASSSIAEAQVDAPPTISALSLNGGSNISLVVGTTTIVLATATVSDPNGFSDIFSISGVAYRTSLGTSCTPNNNNCYTASVANCGTNNCSGTSCVASCSYNIWYYAEPTDSGTPWTGDSWSTVMYLTDTENASTSATSSAVTLLSLLGIRSNGQISYGSFSPGQTMASLTATSVVSSAGNVAMDVAVYGADMVNGTASIPLGNQHFATTSKPYASGTTLLANPGTTIPLALPKPSSTNSPSSSLFWGVAVPSGILGGTYTGYNTFVGVKRSLPWP